MIAIWLAAASAITLAGGLQLISEDYAPEGGNFSIRFPGKPNSKSQSVESKIGKVEVHISTYATSDGNVYMVSYSDLPDAATKDENRETLFKGVVEGAKGGKEVTVTDKPMKFGKDQLPAHYLEFDRGTQHVKLRVILSGNRLYQVSVVGTSRFCNGTDANRFLDSFNISK